MTVRLSDSGIVMLEGACTVEDAEPLLRLLQQGIPAPAVDWTACSHLHTAVIQAILASEVAPSGPCGDAWVRQWLAPQLPLRAMQESDSISHQGRNQADPSTIEPLEAKGQSRS